MSTNNKTNFSSFIFPSLFFGVLTILILWKTGVLSSRTIPDQPSATKESTTEPSTAESVSTDPAVTDPGSLDKEPLPNPEQKPLIARTKYDLLNLFNSNCRAGPNKFEYVSLAKIPPNEEVVVLGKDNEAGDWFLVKWAKLSTNCWVEATLLEYDFDLKLLTISNEIIFVPTEPINKPSGGSGEDGGGGVGCTPKEVQVCEDQKVTEEVCVKWAGNGKCIKTKVQERVEKVCITEKICE